MANAYLQPYSGPPGDEKRNYDRNYPYMSPIYEEESESTGCCFFTNQFYLMTSFGGTLSCVIIFQVLSILLMGFLWPACWCSSFWAHLSLLDTNMKLVYFASLIFTLSFGLFGAIAMSGIYNEKKKKIYPFLILLIVTEIGLFFGAIFAFYKFGQVKDSIMNDPEMIAQMGEMVLKPKMYESISNLMASMFAMFDNKPPDLQAAMELMLKEEMVVLMDAGERLMKFVTICSLIGLNALYITTIVCIIKLIGRMNEYQMQQKMQRVATANYHNGSAYNKESMRKVNYAESVASSVRSRNRIRDEELIVPVSEKPVIPEAEYLMT